MRNKGVLELYPHWYEEKKEAAKVSSSDLEALEAPVEAELEQDKMQKLAAEMVRLIYIDTL